MKYLQTHLKLLLTVVLGSLLSLSSYATDYYVDANASGTNNGSSWTDAFDDLEDALGTALFGDRIFVAAGTCLLHNMTLILEMLLLETQEQLRSVFQKA